MTRIDPPKTRYKHTLTVYGNTHDEIEHELLRHVNGGYLIDSDYHERDEWTVYKGRGTSCMEHINPSQTSERYEEELKAWRVDLPRIEAEQADPVEELAGQIETATRAAIRQVCDDLADVAPALDPLAVEQAMEVTAVSRKVAAHVLGQEARDGADR